MILNWFIWIFLYLAEEKCRDKLLVENTLLLLFWWIDQSAKLFLTSWFSALGNPYRVYSWSIWCWFGTCFFKYANPSLIFIYFQSFQTFTDTFLQQFNVKKCHVHPVYGARIRTHDHESSPITTRPGLPPDIRHLLLLPSFPYSLTQASQQCFPNESSITA